MPDNPSPGGYPVCNFDRLTPVMAQRFCKLCGELFEIEHKLGHPREYCFVCEPPGWQIVKLPHRVKLRRRPSLLPRIPRI